MRQNSDFEKEKIMENRKRVLSAVLLGVILLLVLAAAVGIPLLARQSEKASTPLTRYWAADSAPAQELRAFVSKVTDPADKENFIPEKDRIASGVWKTSPGDSSQEKPSGCSPETTRTLPV